MDSAKGTPINYSKVWLYWKQSELPEVYEDCSRDFAKWLDKMEGQELINISKNLRVKCQIYPDGSRYHEKCLAPNFKHCFLCENAHYFLQPKKASAR